MLRAVWARCTARSRACTRQFKIWPSKRCDAMRCAALQTVLCACTRSFSFHFRCALWWCVICARWLCVVSHQSTRAAKQQEEGVGVVLMVMVVVVCIILVVGEEVCGAHTGGACFFFLSQTIQSTAKVIHMTSAVVRAACGPSL